MTKKETNIGEGLGENMVWWVKVGYVEWPTLCTKV